MERDDQDRPPKPGESDGERSEEEPLRPGLDAADDPDEELDHTILSSPDLEATRVGDSTGPRVSSPATGSS